jgi:hypothetical protein
MNSFLRQTLLSTEGPTLALAYSLTSPGRVALHNLFFVEGLTKFDAEFKNLLPRLETIHQDEERFHFFVCNYD